MASADMAADDDDDDDTLFVEKVCDVSTEGLELVLDTDRHGSLFLVARGKVRLGVGTVGDRRAVARDDDRVVAGAFDVVGEVVRAVGVVDALGLDDLAARAGDHGLETHAREVELLAVGVAELDDERARDGAAGAAGRDGRAT